MQVGLPSCVEDAQQDQAGGADDCEPDGQAREHLLAGCRVRRQPALVAEPSVGSKRDIEKHGGEDTTGDEQRLQVGCTNVADVGDLLALGHGRVVDAVLRDGPVEQESQKGRKPDKAGEDGRYLESSVRGGLARCKGVKHTQYDMRIILMTLKVFFAGGKVDRKVVGVGKRRWDGEISIGENPTRVQKIKGILKIQDGFQCVVKSWLERFGVLK